VLAGAQAAGVASGVARPLTGGLVGDLGLAAAALDEVRETLGDSLYAHATRRGAEMTLDDTVAYVLTVLDVAALAVP